MASAKAKTSWYSMILVFAQWHSMVSKPATGFGFSTIGDIGNDSVTRVRENYESVALPTELHRHLLNL